MEDAYSSNECLIIIEVSKYDRGWDGTNIYENRELSINDRNVDDGWILLERTL